MFEKYDTEFLYYAEIYSCDPLIIENIGGAISVSGTNNSVYKTIICRTQFKAIDIFNPNRFINILNREEMRTMPIVDKDHKLYELYEEDLIRFNQDTKYDGHKILTRMPFKKYKIKKN